jgi:hypothetical protein
MRIARRREELERRAKANRQGITDLSLSAAARLLAKPRPAAEQIMILTEVDTRSIDHVVGLLRPDRRLLFITGAGLSADSGLPTYRGVGGLYGDDRPTRHGYAIVPRADAARGGREPGGRECRRLSRRPEVL